MGGSGSALLFAGRRKRVVLVVAVGLVASGLVPAQSLLRSASADPADDYAAAVLDDGPVAYYRLDETSGDAAGDSSGNVKHGALVDSPVLAQPGAMAGSESVTFSAGDRIDVPQQDFFDTSFTFEAWVKTTSTASSPDYEGEPALTIFGDHTNNVWTSFGVNGGVLQLSRFSIQANAWQYVYGTTAINDGEWHHVAATSYEANNTGYVYVDGYLDGTGTINVYATDMAAVNRIGAGYNNLDGFTGSLDEVALYNYALSPGRVLAHFSGGGGQADPVGDYDTEITADSPAVYYRLAETSGSTAHDVSANAHHGTFAGDVTLGVGGSLPGATNLAATLASGGRIALSPLDFAEVSLSVEAWVKTASTDATSAYEGNPALTVFGDYSATVWFAFGINGGRVRLARHGLGSGSNWQFVDGVSLVNDGQWHHIAATSNATTGVGSVYVDGILEASGPITVTGDDLAAVTRIGTGYGDQDPFEGTIDEIAVYPGALSSTRIRAHYRASDRIPTLHDLPAPPPTTPVSGCIEQGGNVYLDHTVTLDLGDGEQEYTAGCYYYYETCVSTLTGFIGNLQSWSCENQELLLSVLEWTGYTAAGTAAVLVCYAACAVLISTWPALAADAAVATVEGSALTGAGTLVMGSLLSVGIGNVLYSFHQIVVDENWTEGDPINGAAVMYTFGGGGYGDDGNTGAPIGPGEYCPEGSPRAGEPIPEFGYNAQNAYVWDKIRQDHAAFLTNDPPPALKSQFYDLSTSEIAADEAIGRLIRAAFCYGSRSVNTGESGGFIYEIEFNADIGQLIDQYGSPDGGTSRLRLVVQSNGTIITAYPFA